MALQVSVITIGFFGAALLLALLLQLALWSKWSQSVAQKGLALDWVEAGFLAIVGGVIFVGWVGVLLVSFGLFSLFNVSLVLLAAAVGVWLWQRPLPLLTFERPQLTDWLLLVLLLGSAVVYFRPHEYVFGGIDPGSYMMIAATAVRTGDFIIEDEWTAHLRQFPEVTLREQPPQWRTQYLQFVGWYIDDNEPGRLIPQFFPFHAMLIAVGMSIAGLYGGLFVTPIWGTLSLAAVYFVGRRLFNRTVGLLTAVLLALTPSHIYFARYPTTEPLTLLLIFSGLLAFQMLWDHQEAGPLWGILAGAAFGAAFLTRIDLPLVMILLACFFVWRWWQGGWSVGWKTAVSVTTFMTAHALLSGWLLNAPYVWNSYGSVFSLIFLSSPLILIVAIGGSLLCLIVFFLVGRQGWPSFLNSGLGRLLKRAQFRWSVAGGIILLSLFAYFIRPIIQPPIAYPTWPAGTEAYLLDGENWVRLGWYLTPLGLALATLGLAIIFVKYPLNRLAFFLAVTTTTTAQYVYRLFNSAAHIYAMRRYVPIVIPALLLFTAVALWSLFQLKNRRLGWLAGGGLSLLLCAGLLYQARFVLPLRDLQGATEHLISLHDQIKPDAMIIMSEPAHHTFADTIGPPLRFLYGHDIATIRQADETALPFIEDMIAYAKERGRPLQIVTIAPIPEVLRQRFALEPVAFVPIRLPKLRNSFTEFPSTLQTVYYGIEIYDVLPREANQPTAENEALVIDIGTLDTAYIVTGFYGKEPLPGAITMRWTAETAVLEIPHGETDRIVIDIRARTVRLEGVAETAVVVTIDELALGQFTPTDVWETYSFPATIDSAESSFMLQFEAVTFTPAEIGLNNDSRDLGFLLDWVEVTLENETE